MEKITDYNDVAADYMKSQEEFYNDKKDVSREKLLDQIDFSLKNKKILELGFGSGDDLAYLHKKGAFVYGIDLSSEMLKLAQIKHPILKNLFVESFEKMSFKNDFFDLVVSRFTLHYSQNLEKGFKEIYRVMKKNGILIFLVPHPLVDFIVKDIKIYEKSEIIKRGVFADRLYLHYPTHTFSDYLSPFVLQHFELLGFYEEVNIADKNRETGFLVLKLRKKV